MLQLRQTCLLINQRVAFASSSSAHPDHYKTLGVTRDATPQQIKAAFYDLSKKYHPDMNPDDRDRASEMFNKVAEAYEILGSPDKKVLYDLTFQTPQTIRATHLPHSKTANKQKQYTDLDIDYKDFEHFQRSTRRRRFYEENVQMPDEFSQKFGGRRFKSRMDEQDLHAKSYHFVDSRAEEREREERRLMKEVEEMRKKERFSIPTFDQLTREKTKKAEDRVSRQRMWLIFLALISFMMYTLYSESKKRQALYKTKYG